MQTSSIRWTSSVSFIFAASAAAIGLGNIWRFPYMVGENGGAMFVLIYIVCVILLGIPLLVAEVILGRMGRKNPVAAIANVAKKSNRSVQWSWLGGLNTLAGFLILTYYVVIVGWVLDYLGRAIIGQFVNATEASALADFARLQASSWQMLFSDSIVVVAAMGIILLGVKRGLEKSVMLMFPALIILMLFLIGYAATTGGFWHSVVFLFKPELSELNGHTIALALGQAFFSLNVAMGVTIMFSAYLPKTTPVIKSVIAIAIADSGVALLAGLVIFPIVFANGLQPNAGPSLIFQTLPLAFSKIPFGWVISVLFFLMLFFAAFTSIIAIMEPSVCWLMETLNMSRKQAVVIICFAIWVLSIAAITSFSKADYFQIHGITYFKAVDYLTANIMLPIGGLLIAIFAGWMLQKEMMMTEFDWKIKSGWFRTWEISLRYFAPVAIIIILLSVIGLI